ncbi:MULTISPECIES: DUF2509 family protein [Kosakonia]|uniref:DUF2509 family protein n=1 Tax=Kosakonia TaxID=1330547 RepID=UPI0005EDAEDC|nr:MULTISPECIES: DUF2509 family protein [Kosakonia]RCW96370.1 uncharacterized protein DUF2509 [Kosakonia sp. AG348]
MNRQRGMSSLALVLLLLLLGSLMLHGLNLQLSSHIWRVNNENQGIRNAAEIASAMEWARHQTWPAQPALQCQQSAGQNVRSCLRVFTDGAALLIVANAEGALWHLGRVEGAQVRFLPHGWSDFCPIKEEALCRSP